MTMIIVPRSLSDPHRLEILIIRPVSDCVSFRRPSITIASCHELARIVLSL
jgi:hypothetical protein